MGKNEKKYHADTSKRQYYIKRRSIRGWGLGSGTTKNHLPMFGDTFIQREAGH
jgi:hypothetical protein